jgi:Lon protease-like protein
MAPRWCGIESWMPETDTSRSGATALTLPLFPLQTVLFPGGLLKLKIFEARYLDMVADCLRNSRAFGVIALRQGSEVRDAGRGVQLETAGVSAHLLDVDGDEPGILHVRCQGGRRFALSAAQQDDDGLWNGSVEWLEDDAPQSVPEELQPSARALAQAIASLAEQGSQPFLEPHRLEDASWVANRWCEILPISLAAKQKLMELDDALVRLKLVDEFLRSKGVVE